MMVMLSCEPAGGLLGWPQAGAYINIFPSYACRESSAAVECPPLQAGALGSSPEFPSPFLFLSSLPLCIMPSPSLAKPLRLALPPAFLCQFSSHLLGPEMTGWVFFPLDSLPGPVLCIDGAESYP